MESIGTKAYTVAEVQEMLRPLPVEEVRIKPRLSYYDLMKRFSWPLPAIANVASRILGGDRVGWFLTIEFRKTVK